MSVRFKFLRERYFEKKIVLVGSRRESNQNNGSNDGVTVTSAFTVVVTVALPRFIKANYFSIHVAVDNGTNFHYDAYAYTLFVCHEWNTGDD